MTEDKKRYSEKEVIEMLNTYDELVYSIGFIDGYNHPRTRVPPLKDEIIETIEAAEVCEMIMPASIINGLVRKLQISKIASLCKEEKKFKEPSLKERVIKINF